MSIKKKLFLMLFVLCGFAGAKAQDVGIKTNIVDDAFLNVNLGVEVGLAPRWTFDMPASFNSWSLSHGKKWKHWAVQPGVRYWFCDRFGGHFLGVHTHGGQFNMGGFNGHYHFLGTDMRKLKDNRYQGWFVGGGVSYGYAWVLGNHLNLEGEFGFGYSYTRFDRFKCAGCGRKVEGPKSHNYVGPTKVALNLVYLF